MSMSLYVFSSVGTAGGLFQFQERGNKRIRGRLRSRSVGRLRRIYPIYSSGGAERDKTPKLRIHQ